jgi:hypothetical protein
MLAQWCDSLKWNWWLNASFIRFHYFGNSVTLILFKWNYFPLFVNIIPHHHFYWYVILFIKNKTSTRSTLLIKAFTWGNTYTRSLLPTIIWHLYCTLIPRAILHFSVAETWAAAAKSGHGTTCDADVDYSCEGTWFSLMSPIPI